METMCYRCEYRHFEQLFAFRQSVIHGNYVFFFYSFYYFLLTSDVLDKADMNLCRKLKDIWTNIATVSVFFTLDKAII